MRGLGFYKKLSLKLRTVNFLLTAGEVYDGGVFLVGLRYIIGRTAFKVFSYCFPGCPPQKELNLYYNPHYNRKPATVKGNVAECKQIVCGRLFGGFLNVFNDTFSYLFSTVFVIMQLVEKPAYYPSIANLFPRTPYYIRVPLLAGLFRKFIKEVVDVVDFLHSLILTYIRIYFNIIVYYFCKRFLLLVLACSEPDIRHNDCEVWYGVL